MLDLFGDNRDQFTHPIPSPANWCRWWSNRPAVANAASTFSAACCANALSSSPVRWKTIWPASSWPSCCSSKARISKISRMYINSPGGVVTAGMAIHDTMQYIKPKVRTVCIGQAASMGSFLLAAGEPGMRVALPNARIMVHQPSGGARGMASDIEIQAQGNPAYPRPDERSLRAVYRPEPGRYRKARWIAIPSSKPTKR